MITDFSDLTLPEIRRKLLETKELLRYLDEEYNLDLNNLVKPYRDGSELLAQAASYVDRLILFSEDPEQLNLDDPETVLPDSIFTSRHSLEDYFNPLVV